MNVQPTPLASPPRYAVLARLLHWVMALAIVTGWSLGYYASTLSYAAGPAKIETIVLHKTVGVAILALLVVRFATRLMKPAPSWPDTMSPRMRRAATGGHWLLYALMLLVPVTGMLHSAEDGYGTPVFGLFMIPPPFAKTDPIAPILGGIHEWLVWVFLAVMVGHVMMALKHRFLDRDTLFSRMSFGRR